MGAARQDLGEQGPVRQSRGDPGEEIGRAFRLARHGQVLGCAHQPAPPVVDRVGGREPCGFLGQPRCSLGCAVLDGCGRAILQGTGDGLVRADRGPSQVPGTLLGFRDDFSEPLVDRSALIER